MLLLELTLTRLSSVLLWSALTPVVIAVSLAALGLGAAWTRRRITRGGDADLLAVSAASWTAVVALVGLVACVQTAAGFFLGLFALPFFLFGAFAGAVYDRAASRSLTYASDLLGGAAGAAIAPALMSRHSPEDVGMMAVGLAALGAFVVARALPAAPRPRWTLFPLVAAAAHLLVPGGLVAVDPFANFGFRPHLVSQTQGRAGRVVATAYDMSSRTDLVETSEPWVRYLFTDRMYTARIVAWDGRSAAFSDPEAVRLARLKGLVFRAMAPETVLVLGAGGGFDVALALQSGARRVDAVEINASMVALTRRLDDFAGRVYDRPDVLVHAAEARRFVRDTPGPWDAVSLSLLETDPAAARTTTGYQSWVLTSEALTEYLDRLAPSGVVAVVQNTEPLAQKTVATALASFDRRGIGPVGAFERLAVIALPAGEVSPFARLVVVARDPLGPTARARLLEAASDARLDVQWVPGLAGREPYRSLAGGIRTPDDWVRRAADRIGPATDDRPFFYDVNRALPLLPLLTGGAAALLLAGILVREAGTPGASAPGGLVVAGLLGAGFMSLESILIARGQFLLGGPGIAVPLVVGGMLTTAGGSALVLAATGARRPRLVLTIAALGAATLAVAQAFAWPEVVAASPGLSTTHLAAITAFMVAAVALPAGLCFPACVEVWGRRAPGATASLYTVNALAAVLGASVATLVSLAAGISAAMAVGGAAYALAALTALLADSR